MKKSCILLLVLFLVACGFKLRGSYVLPWKSIAINQAENSELYNLLKRRIESSSQTKVFSQLVKTPQKAEALLNLSEGRAKNVFSLDTSGRVSQFRLHGSLNYQAIVKNQLVSSGTINSTRDLSYSDDQALAKESEEKLLWESIRQDMVIQLLRIMSRAPSTPSPSPSQPLPIPARK